MVLHKNGAIFAATISDNVVELSMNLDVVKNFDGRNSQPYTMDANENYLVVGYEYAFVDVYSRKEHDGNGAYRRVMVRFSVSDHNCN